MWITSSAAKVLKPTAIALGNFDGIHRGHQKVFEPILNTPNPIGCYPTLVSFKPHPREFFGGETIELLTPLEEKAKLLEQLGFAQLVLLPFDRELAALSPQDFVEKIIVQQLQALKVSVGEDFRFGYQRKGTSADLQAIAARFGIEVNIVSLQKCNTNIYSDPNVRISSSLIRQALERGDIDQANRMLGRSYTLTGTVVTGQQLGRTIGFPTANLKLPTEKFLPRYGVYAVEVVIEEIDRGDLSTNQFPIKGVMNIGCRPTVEGNAPTVEVHLLDWSGDLYGKTITVSLERFLRPEQKFSSLEALKTQIAADCKAAKELIKN